MISHAPIRGLPLICLALDRFEALSLSYNGGKDCLVLLILYLAAIYAHFTTSKTSQPFPTSIPSIYAKPPDPFPQVSEFVDSSTKEYHLDLTHISTNPGPHPAAKKAESQSSPPVDKDGQVQSKTQIQDQDTDRNSQPSLATTGSSASSVHQPSTLTPAEVLAERRSSTSATLPPNDAQVGHRIVTFRDAFALYLQANPQVLAIFVGTRRTDPHGRHLTHFDMTDGKWPRFMRIHPVIDWHLSEIWAFLRSPYLADRRRGQEVLEYCQMYDEGYTSLGGVNDTLRNPKLRVVDPETGKESWRPAYCLGEDGEERLGRE